MNKYSAHHLPPHKSVLATLFRPASYKYFYFRSGFASIDVQFHLVLYWYPDTHPPRHNEIGLDNELIFLENNEKEYKYIPVNHQNP